jgi:hypothetical protein
MDDITKLILGSFQGVIGRQIEAVFNSSVKLIRRLIKKKRKSKVKYEENYFELLEKFSSSVFFNKHVKIYGYTELFPNLRCRGQLNVDEIIKQKAKEICSKTAIDLNFRYAILENDSCLLGHDNLWDYLYCDFSIVLALRKLSKEKKNILLPLQVSACAVIYCEERQSLLLHQRSHNSHTYPGCFHTFGGSYIVPEKYWKHHKKITPVKIREDNDEILNTILREIYEETNIVILPKEIESSKKVIIQELDTGYVQYVILGINISSEKIDDQLKKTNPKEGDVVLIPFNRIQNYIENPSSWVPTGLSHILLWLYSTAYLDNPSIDFGFHNIKELVFNTIEKIDKKTEIEKDILNY